MLAARSRRVELADGSNASHLPARGRLLVVGHHIVVKEYQELFTAAAALYPELEIQILCPEVYGQMGRVRAVALDPERVPVHTLRAPFAPAGRQHLFFYRGLERALDRLAPDFVYVMEEANSLVTAQLARSLGRRGVPYCFWTSLNQRRDYRRLYPVWNIRRHLFTGCQRRVFASCVGANATSDAARDVLRFQGFEGPVLVRPTNGVGRVFLGRGERRLAQPRASGAPLRVGFVGRLWNWKGVDVLFDAVARMRHRSRVELSVRGAGERAGELRELARRLELTVDWREFLPYDRMPEVLAELDVLVLPSLLRDGIDEKFGRVIVEAMASGTVGVGSRDGGIPLAMAGGGLDFAAGDSGELAARLDLLAESADVWKAAQVGGFEAVRDQYSYRALAAAQIEGLQDAFGWF